ncbi:hypothetical protein [Sinorhizobium meliloti]|uniref:hypothetical protein n=1 Tax=Rhizobium meliloti TaxID=382 RepID=UPI0013E368D8|nr:hypothetical protein [Sinorhizobium meliloti]
MVELVRRAITAVCNCKLRQQARHTPVADPIQHCLGVVGFSDAALAFNPDFLTYKFRESRQDPALGMSRFPFRLVFEAEPVGLGFAYRETEATPFRADWMLAVMDVHAGVL